MDRAERKRQHVIAVEQALRVLALVAALLSIAMAPAAAASGGTPPPDPYHPMLTRALPPLDVLVAQFERIAFSNEFGGDHRRGRIVKWTQPIRVKVNGIGAALYAGEVRDMLHQLRRLSGLSIGLVGQGDSADANFVIQFVDQRAPGQDPCATFIDDADFAIAHVRIIISSYDPHLRRHCIAEELTQALGLADDSKLIFPSIFNDSSRQQALFPWDEVMVRTLYDKRIYTGMTLADAHEIVPQIMLRLISRMPATTHSQQPAPPPQEAPAVKPRPRPEPAPDAPVLPGAMPLEPSAFK